MKIILVFTRIGTLSVVFLLYLLCLPSDGADIGEGCTVNGNCTYSNGTCDDLTCGCVATHYIHDDGSNKDCQLKKLPGGSCTTPGTSTECLDINSECTTESGGNKCRCTTAYYDDDLDDSNVAGTCTLKLQSGVTCMDGGKATECILNAVCTSDGNTGLQCTCNLGFYDNNFNTTGGLCVAEIQPGVTCTQVGQITECVDEAVCQNGGSGLLCTCTSDFYNNGGMCVAKIGVNEICNSSGPANQCKDPMSTCINVSGTHNCTCNSGYYNNGGTCTILTGLKVLDLDVPDDTTGETFFVVTWTNPSTVNFINKYQLILAFNGQNEVPVVDIDKTNTNYNISNLVPGRTYTIILRSVETQSRPTPQTIDVNITDGTRPAIPGAITPNVFNGPTIIISWNITGDLEYLSGTINDTTASPSSFNLTFASQLSSLSVTNLRHGYHYTFTVTAHSNGFSSVAYPQTIRTIPTRPPPPAQFACIDTNIFDRSMKLTWKEPATPNGYIQNYTIYHIYRNMQTTTNGNVMEQEINGLTPEQYYSFKITTVNDATNGESFPSNQIQCRTKAGLSTPPQNFAATEVTSIKITVQWNYPVDSAGVLWGYRIHLKNPSDCVQEIIFQCDSSCAGVQNLEYAYNCTKEIMQNTDSTKMSQTMSYIIEELLPYVKYDVIIQAVNAAGNGNTADISTTTSQEAPQKPLQVTGAEQPDPKTLQVAWQQPLPRPGITNYTVKVYEEKDDASGFVYKESLKKEISGYYTQTTTIDGLEEYWNYKFVIEAATSIGSVESDMSAVVRTKHSAPGVVVNFTIDHPSEIYNQMNVMWSIPPIRQRNSVIKKYVISHNISGIMQSLDVPANTNTVVSLMRTFIVTTEESYEVEVYAVNTQNQEGSKLKKIYYAEPGRTTTQQISLSPEQQENVNTAYIVVSACSSTVAILLLIALVITCIRYKPIQRNVNRTNKNFKNSKQVEFNKHYCDLTNNVSSEPGQEYDIIESNYNTIDVDRSQYHNNILCMEGEYINVEPDGHNMTTFNN